MNQTNKIIKYLAIAFAVFLVISIISGILSIFLFMGGIFDNNDIIDLKQLEINQNIENIDVDIKSTSVTIKQSDTFKIETNNKYIEHKQNDNKLSIKERSHFWHNNKTNLIIYIPSNVLNNVEINAGAGLVSIENITANQLELDLGAGKVEINNLEILNKTKIDGGAGEINIKNGTINNLDMDMGVGKVTINAKILGDSDIDAGVGELNLNLNGREDEYKINVEKGIGSVKLSGNDIKNGVYGNGNNKIDIDGGVGSINIKFDTLLEINYFISFIRTYNILNITQSQEENSYYLTLQQFQGEVDTVLVKNLDKKLTVGKNYEFQFQISNNTIIEDNINSIFENAKILSINETNKEGLDQIQDELN